MGRFHDLILYREAVLVDEHVFGDVTPLVNGILTINRAQAAAQVSMRPHALAFEACAKDVIGPTHRLITQRMLDPDVWTIQHLEGRTYSRIIPLLTLARVTETNPVRIRKIDRWVSVSSSLAEALLALREPMIVNCFGNFWGRAAERDREDHALYLLARFQAYVELATEGQVSLPEIAARRKGFADLPMSLVQALARQKPTDPFELEPVRDMPVEQTILDDPSHCMGVEANFDHVIQNQAEGYQLWLNRDADHPRPLLLELLHPASGRYFPLQQIAPSAVALQPALSA